MTLPLSGRIDASDINVELGRSATAVMSIKDAATGVYGAINTCSPYYPNGSAPHAYSEWYGYNHLAPCLNSNFAFFDDINTGTEDMLYSLTKNYWTQVSSSRPSPASKMTISFWMKMVNTGGVNRAGLMELSPITPGSSTQSLRMEWDLDENTLSPGTYDANVLFFFTDSSGNSVTSKANLADANNSSISGISPNAYWDIGNTGYVDANGYSLITIVIDYAAFGTSTYAGMIHCLLFLGKAYPQMDHLLQMDPHSQRQTGPITGCMSVELILYPQNVNLMALLYSYKILLIKRM
jgi:hypothetical protein